MSAPTRADLYHLVDALPDSALEPAHDALLVLGRFNGRAEGCELDWDVEALRAEIGRPTNVALAPPFRVEDIPDDSWPADEDPGEFDRWIDEIRARRHDG